ncbi:mercuric ion transporter MerT [Noviherbaspirillum sp. ST9]|uniref:mercuric ion transporter MerT n=1 Tax=Noviherbaspirillum sp. ST9 TaxID=3401606 RepID=UPI003B588293
MSTKSQTENIPPSECAPLLVGALAGILASSCCLGPLVLLSLGISGVWIGNLTMLAPIQPAFIAIALVALFFAWKRIWTPITCTPGKMCASPKAKLVNKVLFCLVAAIVIVAFSFPIIAPWFY